MAWVVLAAMLAAPDWIDEVQTYCMVPLLPERAVEMNVTVNGVWGGMGGIHPIITSDQAVPAVGKEYDHDDKAFADASRAAGLKVVAIVPGLEGMDALRAITPHLDEMACRTAEGKPANVGEGMTLMCTNNPAWVAWQFEFGKRGIDSGADLVMLDTPMSASFISGFLKGGFCDRCMDAFEAFLSNNHSPEELEQRFGLKEFDKAEIIRRLSPLQDVENPESRPHHNTSPDDLLFREFIRCKETASFAAARVLISELRAYAEEKGRDVAFATNTADLGAVNPFGHWVRALMFADIFDLYVYEQNHTVTGAMGEPLTRYPRGKWAPWHRLAYSIRHRRSPAVIHAYHMGPLIEQSMEERRSYNTWMAVQCAEAYASNGAYVLYHVDPSWWLKFTKRFWLDAIAVNGFVLKHKDLYEGPLRSGSPLALVFLLNERGRTIPCVYPSYIGFANGLTEGNYPFDVVFAGDGRYVADSLTREELARYAALIIPSPVDPTVNQMEAIRGFVRDGGTVVCQEPQRLGLSPDGEPIPYTDDGPVAQEFTLGKGVVKVLAGDVTATETGDVGERFHQSYDEAPRAQIGELAEGLGVHRLLTRPADGLVGAFPVVQPDRRRVVVHLVNYDIDMDDDAICKKPNVGVVLPRPAFLEGELSARYYAVGEARPRAISVTAGENVVRCTVPELGISGSLVIGVASEERK